MFHLKYPRFRGFFTWDELGCMSRALGFSVDLFKNHLIEEIQAEDNGLPVKQIIKMLDYKLLYKVLHLSQNLHTADWNTCVFRSSVSILDRKALTYEDIYQARIAYQAYEAGDMKGMLIDQHVLLRTLKMCGKTISPMKMMHRVKHNSVMYDEPGRIQLYEFLDLLLWANGYEPYIPEKPYGHFEMEDSLFKLYDFNSLLTHHDEKLASKLDHQFLQEEWAFTKTKYATKSKLTDPAVISANKRIDTESSVSDYYKRTQDRLVNTQKNEFRKLKNEVGNSQTVVYKAAQGYIRQRPVTAPNLTMYDTRGMAAEKRRESRAAQKSLNEKVHKLIKKTEPRDANNNRVQFDMSDKPNVNDYKRCQTPKFVTVQEKEETDKRMERLMFEIETEEGRHEIAMETEMEHYIPGFKEAYLKQKSKSQSAPFVPAKVKVKAPPPERYDLSNMSRPIPKISPCHALRCDARQSMSKLQTAFRGWYGVRSKKGPHYILVSPYFQNSQKGQLMRKMVKMSDTAIKKIHGDFVYRYTKRGEVDRRPVTAPAVMTADEYELKRGRSSKFSRKSSFTSGYISLENEDDLDSQHEDSLMQNIVDENNTADMATVNNEKENIEIAGVEASNLYIGESNADLSIHTDISKGDLSTSAETVETSLSDKVKLMKLTDPSIESVRQPRVKSDYGRRPEVPQIVEEMRSVSAYGNHKSLEEVVPMPYMDHSKPKTVSVGSIGKISLLESISEAKYWEDVMKEQERERLGHLAAKNTQEDEDKVGLESSQNIQEKDENVNRNIEKGENEILSMILKEDEMTNEHRLESACSDRLSPHPVYDREGPPDDVCESPTANSTKSDEDVKVIKEVRKATKPGKKHKHKNNESKKKNKEENVIIKPLEEEGAYLSENEKYLRKLNEMFAANVMRNELDNSGKRQVYLKSGRGTSSRSSGSRSEGPRYQRLVNRVKEDISPRLAKRILSGP